MSHCNWETEMADQTLPEISAPLSDAELAVIQSATYFGFEAGSWGPRLTELSPDAKLAAWYGCRFVETAEGMKVASAMDSRIAKHCQARMARHLGVSMTELFRMFATEGEGILAFFKPQGAQGEGA